MESQTWTPSDVLGLNYSLQLGNSSQNETLLISTSPSVLKVVTDVVITTTLVIIMLGMGSTIEIKPLLGHLRRPTGIAIGMLSQCVVLPAVTFGLAHALQLPKYAALGMLVMGSCPGGSTSNVFTYWSDGDVALSISMTAVSTILAMGTMPLNLFIYSRSWTDEPLIIPYVNIAVSFVMTIGPATVGIFLRWKWPKFADIIVKCGSFAGAIAVVLTLILVSVRYPFMYNVSWRIYLGGFLLPLVGFTFGYLVATLFRMEAAKRRTVSLETGIQNFPLCLTLLTLTFKKQMFAQISLFPLMYGITCIITSVLFVAVYKCVQVCQKRSQEKKEYKFQSVSVNDKQEKTYAV